MTYLTTIPFSGFNNTIHSCYFDSNIEQRIDYFEELTGYPMSDDLVNLAWDSQYDSIAYARRYADSLLTELGLTGIFDALQSPREYNFATDRIFVNLNDASVFKMLFETDFDIMNKICVKKFTHRSGYISHYSTDWQTWGDFGNWDHNQIGTLLDAWIMTTEPGCVYDFEYGVNEAEIMESATGDGFIDSCIDSPDRFWKIHNYLSHDRVERKPCTMAQWYEKKRAENRPFNETSLGGLL